jgi:tetratricopeptide (TPR) repeat protein
MNRRSRQSGPRLSTGRKALYSIVVCGALLLGLESVLWIAGVEPLSRRVDELTGMPSVFKRETDIYRTRQKLRNRAFNDQSFPAARAGNGFRVFVMGGSSAYGFPRDADGSFSGMLQDVLQASHPERGIEVINAAGMSYGMRRVASVAREVLAYRPDLLIIYSGHNEFVEVERTRPQPGRLATLREWFSHSRTYSVVHTTFRPLALRFVSTPLDLTVDRRPVAVFNPEDKQQVVARFEHELRALVKGAHDAGTELLLVTTPCNVREWRPERSIVNTSLTETERAAWLEHLGAGRIHLSSGRWPEAVVELEQARGLAPGYAETHYLLARASEGIGNWGEARESFALACELDAAPIRRLAAMNEAIRRVATEQETILLDADAIFEDRSAHGSVGFSLIEDYVHPNEEGHRLIARWLWRTIEEQILSRDDSPPSEEFFDRIVGRRTTTPPTVNAGWFFNQGVVLQQQGQTSRAVDSYYRALELNPDYVEAALNLVRLLAAAGEFEPAESLADEALIRRPNHADAHHVRGRIHAQRGEWEAAVHRFRGGLALDPENANLRLDLGNALLDLGRDDAARQQFARALAIDPTHPGANFGMALIHMAAGRPQTATDYLWRSLESRANDADTRNNLGVAYLQLRRPRAAEPHFREAVRLRPNNPDFHYNLGLTRTELSRFEEATGSFSRVLELAPDHPEAHEALRRIQSAANDR